MRERLNRFMYGRYGQDQLNQFILLVGFVLVVINMFVRSGILSGLVLAVLIICYYRMLSRDTYRRSEENRRYLELRGRVTSRFHKRSAYERQQDRMYRIYHCPSCHQKVRVPRGKGKIIVTCPKCRCEFQKRS